MSNDQSTVGTQNIIQVAYKLPADKNMIEKSLGIRAFDNETSKKSEHDWKRLLGPDSKLFSHAHVVQTPLFALFSLWTFRFP